MQTLDKLTLPEMLSIESVHFDGEVIDIDDLFALAERNKEDLYSFKYSIEKDPLGNEYLSVW